MKNVQLLLATTLAAVIAACSSGDGFNNRIQQLTPLPGEPQVVVAADTKQLLFSWPAVNDASHYRLMENPDGHSGYTQVGDDIPAGTLSVSRDIAVHVFDWVDAQYIVEACNVSGCSASNVATASGAMLDAIGYFKASNTDSNDWFGEVVAMSANGDTLAVGAPDEGSSTTGINGDEADNSAASSGAVYVFRFNGSAWQQQAYIKASNTGAGDRFGEVMALSADGNTLAVGAWSEASAATGIDGDQDDNSAFSAGAVYLYRFDGTDWNQQAYIKASNTDIGDSFGGAVALSSDGDTLAVGASGEASSAIGIDGDQDDNSAFSAGSVYLYRFDGTDWNQQAYIKASNTDVADFFGWWAVALSADGNTLAVGAVWEASSATGVNGDQDDNSAFAAGAVYLYRFDGTDWNQQAYIKASNTDIGDSFGGAVALSADGSTLAVGAILEASIATGVNGDQAENSAYNAGAVYMFRFDGTDWNQQAYIKASNTDAGDSFGWSTAMSADGNTLAVGAISEASIAAGVNGDQAENSDFGAGAVYVFDFDGTDWNQQAYIKASNTDVGDLFGWSTALSDDGDTLAVGALWEASSTTGINGAQDDNLAEESGGVYVY